LKQTVAMGYSEYEGGIQGDSLPEFKAFLKEIGLKYVAGGVGMAEDMDVVKARLDDLNELGASYLVTYWPWFVGAPFKMEDCVKSAPILNKIGETAKEHGLGFCWHNHDKEFQPMENGQLPYDFLMAETDPELVQLEMDIYWVVKGGADPTSLLKKNPGRTRIMHVKDMTNKADQDFTCPGSGIIDFPAVFAEAKKQGIKHYFVERDQVVDGLECLRTSSVYLTNLRF
jgi:sugar phosphate isomerase/epimerase